MDPITDNDTQQERTVSPTVSKDKWMRHALRKMLGGYALIIPPGRRSANFFQATKGYEMCAYGAAMEMVRRGYVVEAGRHYLGTLYVLTEEAAAYAATLERRRPAAPRVEAAPAEPDEAAPLDLDVPDELLSDADSDDDAVAAGAL